jgi:hypothetical protein
MSFTSTIKKTATKIATLTKGMMPSGMMPSGASTGMLNNKWILYAILFISVVDLFNFYSKGDATAIAIFLVVGFLTTYFSKNMLVVLVVAIAVTHIARFGSASMEGMETEEEEEEEEEVTEGLKSDDESEEKKKNELTSIQSSLDKIGIADSSEQTTAALIEQTKKVQENMQLLEPYLKKAEQVTEPLKKPEGFCDYSTAYSSTIKEPFQEGAGTAKKVGNAVVKGGNQAGNGFVAVGNKIGNAFKPSKN